MPDPSPNPEEPGWLGRTLHGRYRIDAPLGAGGLGLVFRGTHLGLDRPVAVKVLHRELLSNVALRQRFEREVKTLSRLAHPHIVTLTDSGVLDDGVGYLVMELLEGESLEQRLARGRLDPAEAVAIVRQVLLGLAEAHDKGVLHRDVKPGNIFLQPLAGGGTHVKLLDFGLAKVRGDAAADPAAFPTLTADGTIVGTPTYMAPEQAAGATLDPSSDVYAVGVVLFEMLTGAPPFVRESKLEVIRAHLRDAPPALEAVRPALEPTDALRALVDRALAKDRLGRFATAKEMLAAIDALPDPIAVVGAEAAPAARAVTGTEDTLAVGSEELEPVSSAPGHGSAAVTTPALRAASSPVAATGDTDRARRRSHHLPRWILPLLALAIAGGLAVWWRWPSGASEPSSTRQPRDASAAQRAPERAEPDASEAAVEEESGPGNPFRSGTLPDELRDARRKILRGRWLEPGEARDVDRYQRAHRGDARPSLLLARHHRLRGQWAPTVRHYRRAHRIDSAVIGFSPMLSDLLRAAQQAPSSRAAIGLIVEAFGRDALPAVEEEIRGRRASVERRRLERLARRLRALPEE